MCRWSDGRRVWNVRRAARTPATPIDHAAVVGDYFVFLDGSALRFVKMGLTVP
jgi:hypothetical protein